MQIKHQVEVTECLFPAVQEYGNHGGLMQRFGVQKITHQHVFDKYVTLPDTRNILHLGRFPGWTHQNAHCPYRFNLCIIEPVAARMISVPLSGKKTT